MFKRTLTAAFMVAMLSSSALLAPASAHADEPAFKADASVAQAATPLAQDAVRFAHQRYDIVLDGSEASIDAVELTLDHLSAAYASVQPRPSDAEVMSFAQRFGAYVGEVYRRQHGGEWGWVTLDGQRFPGVRTRAGRVVWPNGRVYDRITRGGEFSVVAYYGDLLKR